MGGACSLIDLVAKPTNLSFEASMARHSFQNPELYQKGRRSRPTSPTRSPSSRDHGRALQESPGRAASGDRPRRDSALSGRGTRPSSPSSPRQRTSSPASRDGPLQEEEEFPRTRSSAGRSRRPMSAASNRNAQGFDEPLGRTTSNQSRLSSGAGSPVSARNREPLHESISRPTSPLPGRGPWERQPEQGSFRSVRSPRPESPLYSPDRGRMSDVERAMMRSPLGSPLPGTRKTILPEDRAPIVSNDMWSRAASGASNVHWDSPQPSARSRPGTARSRPGTARHAIHDDPMPSARSTSSPYYEPGAALASRPLSPNYKKAMKDPYSNFLSAPAGQMFINESLDDSSDEEQVYNRSSAGGSRNKKNFYKGTQRRSGDLADDGVVSARFG